MKLVTYQYNGKEEVGVMNRTLDGVIALKELGYSYESMNSLIEGSTREVLADISAKAAKATKCIHLAEVSLQAPIPRPMQDIVCVGRNFLDHIKEGAKFRNDSFDATNNPSVYFAKRVNRAVPDGGFIEGHLDLDDQLDYESELAVIIGKDACNVSREASKNYIFGYTIVNDISARRIQNSHKQWYFGKSLDGFTPMGPWIVTSDEFDTFPPKMRIQSKVNGQLRQDSDTSMMIYDIPYIIEELTHGMTLLAGSIISTGTPSGVGMGMTPPTFLKNGDTVQCIVSGIGTLTNTVRCSVGNHKKPLGS